MKCLDNGTIQSYIDGELEINEKKNIENHILTCDKCERAIVNAKNIDDFVFEKISIYKENNSQSINPKIPEFVNNRRNNAAEHPKKNFLNFLYQYRKIAAMICVCSLVALSVTVQPVRAFIKETLHIFRVENVKGFSLDIADLNEIQSKLRSKQGQIDLDKIGSIEMNGFEEKSISVEEAESISEFNVLLPAVKEDTKFEIKKVEAGTMDFTLNVQNVNELMKSFGSKELLPLSVDGKTFTIDFPSQISFDYNYDGKKYIINETKTPEILVPADVNEDEIFDSVVNMPILPEDLKNQLKSVKDWKKTLYIPLVDSITEEVSINGNKGFLILPQGDTNNEKIISVFWYNSGAIYSVSCNNSKENILKFAEALR